MVPRPAGHFTFGRVKSRVPPVGACGRCRSLFYVRTRAAAAGRSSPSEVRRGGDPRRDEHKQFHRQLGEAPQDGRPRPPPQSISKRASAAATQARVSSSAGAGGKRKKKKKRRMLSSVGRRREAVLLRPWNAANALEHKLKKAAHKAAHIAKQRERKRPSSDGGANHNPSVPPSLPPPSLPSPSQS